MLSAPKETHVASNEEGRFSTQEKTQRQHMIEFGAYTVIVLQTQSSLRSPCTRGLRKVRRGAI